MSVIEQPIIIHLTDQPQQFIYEYSNGRRVLVVVDPQTGKAQFIREL